LDLADIGEDLKKVEEADAQSQERHNEEEVVLNFAKL